MITCGFCGHPGTHATIIERGQATYCTGCPQCQEELRRLSEAEDPDPPDDEPA
jgi:hypothetical protein